jgi:hypothetical protein
LKKQTAIFLVGTLGLNAARLAREFLVIHVLGAGTQGATLWAILSLVRQYGAFSDLGASNALARLVPEAIVKGDEARLSNLVGTAWSGAMGSTALVSLIGIAVAGATGFVGDLAVIGALALVTLLLDKQFLVSVSVLRSEQKWKTVTLEYLLLGVLELALGWGLGRAFGLNGALLGTALALLITALVFARSSDVPIRPVWDRSLVKPIFSLGAVMLAYGLANIAIHNVDRVALVSFGAPSDWISSYHLAGYASIGVAQIAAGTMSVYASRLFRAGADEHHKFRGALGLPTYGLTAIGIVAGGATLALLAIALPIVGGKAAYDPALLISLLAAEVLLCWTMPAENALVGLNRGAGSVWIRYVGVLVAFLGAGWAIRAGHGLVGVAIARVVAQALVSFAVLGLACRAMKCGPWRPLAGLALPVVYSVVAGALVHATLGTPTVSSGALRAALAGGVFTLLLLPLGLSLVWAPLRAPIQRALSEAP